MLGPDTLSLCLEFDNYCYGSWGDVWTSTRNVKENRRVNTILLLRKADDIFAVAICYIEHW